MQSTYSRVASVLDGLRWKPIQTRVTLVLGLGWMLDAFEVNIIAGVLGVLQKLWQLTTEQASLLVWFGSSESWFLLERGIAVRQGRLSLRPALPQILAAPKHARANGR